MNTRQASRRRRRADEASDLCCFPCFFTKRQCVKTSTGCCRTCKSKLSVRGNEEDAPSLLESPVLPLIRRQVELFFPRPTPANLNIECRKSTEVRDVRSVIHIDTWEEFYPRNEVPAQHMDRFIWDNCSIKMDGTNTQSPLVHYATLAGGYLCLIFPVATDLPKRFSSNRRLLTEDELKRRVVIFSIFRFGELIQYIMAAIRGVGSGTMDNDQSLTAISAAGVMYCELSYFLEGFRGLKPLRLLCDDNDLQEAMLSWLRLLGKTLLSLLRSTGATFPNWGVHLQQSRKKAKRAFRLEEISLALEPNAPNMSPENSSKGTKSLSSSPFSEVSTKVSLSTPPTGESHSFSGDQLDYSGMEYPAQLHHVVPRMEDQSPYATEVFYENKKSSLLPLENYFRFVSRDNGANSEYGTSSNAARTPHSLSIKKSEIHNLAEIMSSKQHHSSGTQHYVERAKQIQEIDLVRPPEDDGYAWAIDEVDPARIPKPSPSLWRRQLQKTNPVWPPEIDSYSMAIDESVPYLRPNVNTPFHLNRFENSTFNSTEVVGNSPYTKLGSGDFILAASRPNSTTGFRARRTKSPTLYGYVPEIAMAPPPFETHPQTGYAPSVFMASTSYEVPPHQIPPNSAQDLPSTWVPPVVSNPYPLTPDPEPPRSGSEYTGNMVTIDPRYLSYTDWYPGQFHV